MPIGGTYARTIRIITGISRIGILIRERGIIRRHGLCVDLRRRCGVRRLTTRVNVQQCWSRGRCARHSELQERQIIVRGLRRVVLRVRRVHGS
jgi:hypothetical protein